MYTIRKLALYALASIGTLALTSATSHDDPKNCQITVPDSAPEQTVIEVKVKDPTRANQTIRIDIDNGRIGAENQTDSIQITLNEAGEGKGTWTSPPGWDGALFNDPDGDAEEQLTLLN